MPLTVAIHQYQTNSAKGEEWIKAGGTFIAQKRAARWLSRMDWLKAKFRDDEDVDEAFDTSMLHFGDREVLAGKKRLAGAVFMTRADLSRTVVWL